MATLGEALELRAGGKLVGPAEKELEVASDKKETTAAYDYRIEVIQSQLHSSGKPNLVVDWSPMIVNIMHDMGVGESVGSISKRFHNTLVEITVDVAKLMSVERIVLTGGCFQNMFLIEHAVIRLQNEGFRPYWHQRIPTNDGGISLGQVFAYFRSVGTPDNMNEKQSAISQIDLHSLSEVHS